MHACEDMLLHQDPTTSTTWGPVPPPPPQPQTGQGVDREARCVTCQLTPGEDGDSGRRRGCWGLQESRKSDSLVSQAMYLQGIFHSSAAWTEWKKKTVKKYIVVCMTNPPSYPH